MMLSKRNLYTAMGIALSFVIAIGGWALTSKLIDGKADALLSVTGSVKVPVVASTDTGKEPDESGGESPHVLPRLTATEISAVLQNWKAAGSERPHEPTDGQLSMEQAIEAGKAGLSYFCEQGVIPTELLELEYDKINAYLYENQPRGQETGSLDPFYSYWTVSLTNGRMSALLTINAVTGQIWKAEIASTISSVNFNEVQAEHMLDVFTSYLDLGDGDLIEAKYDEYTISANMSFAGGMFEAVTTLRAEIVDNRAVFSRFNISLHTP